MRQNKVVSGVLGSDNTLSPSDVMNHEFRRSLVGGYSASEVDHYLARVADVIEDLVRQVRDLKAQVAGQKETIDGHRQMEETLRNALVTSQKFGEDVIESARREASLLVEAGRLEKTRTESEAREIPAALSREIHRLQDQRDRLEADMRAILAAHEALLENGKGGVCDAREFGGDVSN